MKFTIYLIEDDIWYLKMLNHQLLFNPDHEVKVFSDPASLVKNLTKKPDLICMDFMLPGINGYELLDKIFRINPKQDVIVISAQEDINTVVKLIRRGVADYIVKDENTKQQLWKSIEAIKERKKLNEEFNYLKDELKVKYDFTKFIVGNSKKIEKVFELIPKTLNSNINVLLSGETGTGKELVAKSIHYNSTYSNGKFVPINVSAIPEQLLESELFGYEKGAFTGADKTKKGKIELAHKGTLFLDEISEMSKPLQAKLLRVLQERELTRVGGLKTIPVDFRLISASNKDLNEQVRLNNFREDFYFRLIGFPICLPPLRERDNDVLILAKHFAEEFSKQNKRKTPSFTVKANEKLLGHCFPGNVRELKSVVELACVLCDDFLIQPKDISFIKNIFDFSIQENLTLKEHEVKIIKHHLENNNHNVSKTSKILDISKTKIYDLLKKGLINI